MKQLIMAMTAALALLRKRRLGQDELRALAQGKVYLEPGEIAELLKAARAARERVQ